MNPGARNYYVRWRTAVESHRPLPLDVAHWLRCGLYAYERGVPLERALGLTAGSGQAWRHPVRQVRRARLESLVLTVADCAGGRNSRSASRIAAALTGDPVRLPSRALDFLFKLNREHPEVPRSRTPILQILQGNTRAQRDGLVQSWVAIQTGK